MRIFTEIRKVFTIDLSLRLEIEKIKKKLENQDKNIELFFCYLDELIEKQEKPKERRKLAISNKHSAPYHKIV